MSASRSASSEHKLIRIAPGQLAVPRLAPACSDGQRVHLSMQPAPARGVTSAAGAMYV
jgi:hypothetical protein